MQKSVFQETKFPIGTVQSDANISPYFKRSVDFRVHDIYNSPISRK